MNVKRLVKNTISIAETISLTVSQINDIDFKQGKTLSNKISSCSNEMFECYQWILNVVHRTWIYYLDFITKLGCIANFSSARRPFLWPAVQLYNTYQP